MGKYKQQKKKNDKEALKLLRENPRAAEEFIRENPVSWQVKVAVRNSRNSPKQEGTPLPYPPKE